MDFKDTESQAIFRQKIRAWLNENAVKRVDNLYQGMEGEQAFLEAKEWYKKVFDAGFACLTWPSEYGGAGMDQMAEVIWSQEVAKFQTRDSYFVIGIGNCGPALLHYGQEEMKQRLLPRMASAEDVWCQLFSEPSAGSDVAGLSTKAEQVGEKWKINGQKIWTSGAQYADYGLILCRTDPTVSKYRGLTVFMIDMKQPGVEIRPIKQMDGGQHFNEVFFNDAETPDHYRLGEINGGWSVALTILMSERLAISSVQPTGFPQFFDWFMSDDIDGKAINQDPEVRLKTLDWFLDYAGLQATNKRLMTQVSQGGFAGAEASLGKLVGANMNQEIAQFVCKKLAGITGLISDPDLAIFKGHFQHSLLFSPGVRLAGGTDEIMRNIIAEQVLGLPQEPRADKGIAFNQLKTGNVAQ